MNSRFPVKTEDGSHTLFNETVGEHYHSLYGAIQESEHIFIRAGLGAFHPAPEIMRVLEIGFGTGLNGLLTMLWSEKNEQPVEFLGIEAFPVSRQVLNRLNYPDLLHIDKASFLMMHESSSCFHPVGPFFSAKVLHQTFQEYQPEKNSFHVVFFDAFSPDSQPEMWMEDGFLKLYEALLPGGILVTYSCKGKVKRMMKAAHFSIEKLPGPPGKREFLRATAQKQVQRISKFL